MSTDHDISLEFLSSVILFLLFSLTWADLLLHLLFVQTWVVLEGGVYVTQIWSRSGTGTAFLGFRRLLLSAECINYSIILL